MEPAGSRGEIGEQLGLTRERVRQLERRALKKLREMAMTSECRPAFEAIADFE